MKVWKYDTTNSKFMHMSTSVYEWTRAGQYDMIIAFSVNVHASNSLQCPKIKLYRKEKNSGQMEMLPSVSVVPNWISSEERNTRGHIFMKMTSFAEKSWKTIFDFRWVERKKILEPKIKSRFESEAKKTFLPQFLKIFKSGSSQFFFLLVQKIRIRVKQKEGCFVLMQQISTFWAFLNVEVFSEPRIGCPSSSCLRASSSTGLGPWLRGLVGIFLGMLVFNLAIKPQICCATCGNTNLLDKVFTILCF